MIYTPVYAGMLTLMFVFLSLRVIALRHEARVGFGDGGNRRLLRRLRVHANFAEYVPLCLLLMALIEIQAGPAWIVHLTGLLLLAGRSIHAYGVSREPEVGKLRVIGMALTFTALIVAALANLALGLPVAVGPG